jgi:hypothetical protein
MEAGAGKSRGAIKRLLIEHAQIRQNAAVVGKPDEKLPGRTTVETRLSSAVPPPLGETMQSEMFSTEYVRVFIARLNCKFLESWIFIFIYPDALI